MRTVWADRVKLADQRLRKSAPTLDVTKGGQLLPAVTPQNMVALQRTIGNRALAVVVQRGKRGGRTRGKGGHQTARDTSLKAVLRSQSNDSFFTSHFLTSHVQREFSPNTALTKYRPGKNTTVLFLEGENYEKLADEVRSRTRALAKTRALSIKAKKGNPTFISDASFDYVTVFDNNGAPHLGKLRHGHLVFSVTKKREITAQGQQFPLLAINHCEATEDTKHPDEAWEYQSEAASESEVSDADTDESEVSDADTDESAVSDLDTDDESSIWD